MNATPVSRAIVDEKIAQSGLNNVGRASIREIRALINEIEKADGTTYIRMEMGIPGLPAAQIGIDAEKAALDSGCASL